MIPVYEVIVESSPIITEFSTGLEIYEIEV